MSAPRRRKVSAVLFDGAGTLIHPREMVGETYARFAAKQGVVIPPWRLEDAFRRALRSAPPTPLGEEGERAWWREAVRTTFRAADQMKCFADFEACYQAIYDYFARADAWVATPDLAPVLTALRAGGRKLAIASNFDHRAPAVFAGLGLAPYFDLIWLPTSAGIAKPDPRFFSSACERLGVSAAETVMVGNDLQNDLAAARAAGLRAIDIASLASLASLPELLDELEREEIAD
jgi:putative hydrolase of the HAD superfamily